MDAAIPAIRDFRLMHAVPKDRPFRRHARERILIAALRQAAEAAGVRFKVSVQDGDPAGVILLHARARRPDPSERVSIVSGLAR